MNTMEQLLEILEDLKPAIDFSTATDLIDGGHLDSFDIISIVTEISEVFDIQVSPVEIVPENFNSAEGMCRMITRLMDN